MVKLVKKFPRYYDTQNFITVFLVMDTVSDLKVKNVCAVTRSGENQGNSVHCELTYFNKNSERILIECEDK